MVDLAIIGGGPAALSAAIYAARAGLGVVAYEKGEFGGILPNIPLIENYPGFVGEGSRLAQGMCDQAAKSGAALKYGECTNIERDGDIFKLTIDGESVLARVVLAASGSEPKQLDFTPNAPVSYCALCDGPLVKGQNIAVIGGANSAVQEAIYLAGIAKNVVIITHSQLKADQELADTARQLSNVKVIEHTKVTPAALDQSDHIFVYIGKLPATKFLHHLAQEYAILDHAGYILSDTDNTQYSHQTVCNGLFTAGDVRAESVKQVVTAAADGAAAAIEITNWLKTQK